jgi:hypothetical protein
MLDGNSPVGFHDAMTNAAEGNVSRAWCRPSLMRDDVTGLTGKFIFFMIRKFILYACIAALCGSITSGCGKKKDTTMTIHELVKLYGQKQGGDDYAGPELQTMGTKGKDELIRIIGGQ